MVYAQNLKQIYMLDEEIALEGGWTEKDIKEELVKLKKELAREREKLKVTLQNGSHRLGGKTAPGGSSLSQSSFAPNASWFVPQCFCSRWRQCLSTPGLPYETYRSGICRNAKRSKMGWGACETSRSSSACPSIPPFGYMLGCLGWSISLSGPALYPPHHRRK